MVMVASQVKIPTIDSRRDLANDLALLTGGDIIIDPVGDGSERSATDNHVRAMLSADRSKDWVVIMEDDASPIERFTEILDRQLESLDEDCLVSLYLGRQRPTNVQKTIQRTVISIPEGCSWLRSKSLFWGVGVCIPTRHIDSVAEYALTSTRPWDQAVSLWALTNETPVMYTWPSMVDHVDVETTIRHSDGNGRTPGRVAWSVGEPSPNGTITVLK